MNSDQIYEFWRGMKMIVRFGGQVSADAMHINLGLAGFFLFLGLFRRSKRAAIYAWFAVMGFQIANEFADIIFDLQQIGTVKEWNTIRDTILTLFWPSIFTGYFLYRQKKRKGT